MPSEDKRLVGPLVCGGFETPAEASLEDDRQAAPEHADAPHADPEGSVVQGVVPVIEPPPMPRLKHDAGRADRFVPVGAPAQLELIARAEVTPKGSLIWQDQLLLSTSSR